MAPTRLATAADVERIAELSVLGFKDSEIFRFVRPHYQDFTQDSVISFANTYRSQLSDPQCVVVVAEDWPCLDEGSQVPRDGDEASGKRVVVGVASWQLPEGSKHTGEFIVPNVGSPELALNRDICQRRLDRFTQITEAKKKEYLKGVMVGEKLVIHPSYRRRGHARDLIRWGQHLSENDAVGVISSHMGEPVYLGMGYRVIGEMQVPDDGEVKGFSQRILMYKKRP